MKNGGSVQDWAWMKAGHDKGGVQRMARKSALVAEEGRQGDRGVISLTSTSAIGLQGWRACRSSLSQPAQGYDVRRYRIWSSSEPRLRLTRGERSLRDT
jgi:hypothetical protein